MSTCLQQRTSEVKKVLWDRKTYWRRKVCILYQTYSIKRSDGCLTVFFFFFFKISYLKERAGVARKGKGRGKSRLRVEHGG